MPRTPIPKEIYLKHLLKLTLNYSDQYQSAAHMHSTPLTSQSIRHFHSRSDPLRVSHVCRGEEVSISLSLFFPQHSKICHIQERHHDSTLGCPPPLHLCPPSIITRSFNPILISRFRAAEPLTCTRLSAYPVLEKQFHRPWPWLHSSRLKTRLKSRYRWRLSTSVSLQIRCSAERTLVRTISNT